MTMDLDLLAAHFKHQAHLVALDMRNISAWADAERGVVIQIIWHRNSRPPNTDVIVCLTALEDYVELSADLREAADARFRFWLLANLGEVRTSDGDEELVLCPPECVVGSRELNG